MALKRFSRTNLLAGDDSEEPVPPLSLKERGKTSTWERAVVYDCEECSLEVRSKSKLRQGVYDRVAPAGAYCTKILVEDDRIYREIQLPRTTRQVDLFAPHHDLDAAPLSENKDYGDHVLIAKLHLKNLGWFNRILLSVGRLTTLYIRNGGQWGGGETKISRSSDTNAATVYLSP